MYNTWNLLTLCKSFLNNGKTERLVTEKQDVTETDALSIGSLQFWGLSKLEARSPDPGPGLWCMQQEPKDLLHCLLLSQVLSRELDGKGREPAGTKLLPICNVGTAGSGGLTCTAMPSL